MKKYAAIITSLTVATLLSQTNLFNDILMFVLVGAVPGTTRSVPPSIMLLLICLASCALAMQLESVRGVSRYVIAKLRSFYTTRKQTTANQA